MKVESLWRWRSAGKGQERIMENDYNKVADKYTWQCYNETQYFQQCINTNKKYKFSVLKMC